MLHLLPDELLLEVAASIQDNKSLVSLALTHRSVRSIAHESLIRAATVPFRDIPEYIMLLDQHPQWAETITKIELQDSKKDIEDIKYISCTPRQLNIVKDLISKLPKGYIREKARYRFKTSPQNPQLWTALLFAALPNARGLRFAPGKEYEDTYVYRSLLWHWDGKGFWNKVPLLQYAQSRLQTLTVRAPSDIYDPIGVSHLVNLKTLVVDGECLRPVDFRTCGTHGLFMAQRTHPMGIVPDSLETLHLYGDERTVPWGWLFELQWYQCSPHCVPPAFRRLKLRLYFNISCRTLAHFLAYRFEPDSYSRIDAIELFRKWRESGIDFQAYFRDPRDDRDAFGRPELYTRGDLLEEYVGALRKAGLDPWWKLGLCGEERKGAGWRRYLERDYLLGRPIQSVERRHSISIERRLNLSKQRRPSL